MKLLDRIKDYLKRDVEKQLESLPPDLVGFRFDNNEGGIHDGAQYTTTGKEIPDWLRATHDDGFDFGDRANPFS